MEYTFHAGTPIDYPITYTLNEWHDCSDTQQPGYLQRKNEYHHPSTSHTGWLYLYQGWYTEATFEDQITQIRTRKHRKSKPACQVGNCTLRHHLRAKQWHKCPR